MKDKPISAEKRDLKRRIYGVATVCLLLTVAIFCLAVLYAPIVAMIIGTLFIRSLCSRVAKKMIEEEEEADYCRRAPDSPAAIPPKPPPATDD